MYSPPADRPTSRPSSAAWRRTTTWPTRAWPPSSSSPCACSARCSSRATPAWARPRSPRRWPPGPAAGWSGSSATRASTPPRPLYEWDHARQLLHLRAAEAAGRAAATGAEALEGELYDERFLVRRPLLQALVHARRRPAAGAAHRRDRPGRRRVRGLPARAAVRLGGHHPRAGHGPGRGPAGHVLTSNRTRDVHDALKRRCLYHWVEQPDVEREVAIVRLRAPEVRRALARQVAAAVERDPHARAVQAAGRRRDHRLGPGAGDCWAGRRSTPRRSTATLGSVVKYREDAERVREPGHRRPGAGGGGPQCLMPASSWRSPFVRALRGARACPCPPGRPSSTPRALAAVGIRRPAAPTGRAGRRWSAGPRTSPPTTGPSPPCSAAGRRCATAGAAHGGRGPCSMATTTRRRARRAATEPARDGRRAVAALERHRGPAPQGPRRLHARRAGRGPPADGRPAGPRRACAARAGAARAPAGRGRPTCGAPCAGRCAPAARCSGPAATRARRPAPAAGAAAAT